MLFICDDDLDRVFRWRRGPDLRWGTKDDRVSSFGTDAFGSSDPEGLAIAPGEMFVVDGAGTEVYRITPGPNGRFDGVAPEGDDRVSSFDTSDLGLQEPEGAVFDPATGDLYLVSRRDHVIVRATVSGELVESFDISDSGIRRPSDITLAPASDGSAAIHAYLTDRGTDNAASPDENDGRIFEFALG
jgi:DNA-binding beta-propeller fold protein YncE